MNHARAILNRENGLNMDLGVCVWHRGIVSLRDDGFGVRIFSTDIVSLRDTGLVPIRFFYRHYVPTGRNGAWNETEHGTKQSMGRKGTQA